MRPWRFNDKDASQPKRAHDHMDDARCRAAALGGLGVSPPPPSFSLAALDHDRVQRQTPAAIVFPSADRPRERHQTGRTLFHRPRLTPPPPVATPPASWRRPPLRAASPPVSACVP
eukprot:TRINITY_DN9615_c0_g1_i1.p2 TRINITY_DN9615_c0_g1~~TRINITY_DN9615_c0_g1_i1.p2  ORF type:complete len:128 (+),score=11.01 TRINITY_DN9615_c0_g1_i1:39-386(+)